MAGDRERVTFTRSSAERIANAVRVVEIGERDPGGLQFPPAQQQQQQLKHFRIGTISATWGKGDEATVTQIKADGTVLSPTVTFTATNWFATVTTDGGTKKVLCVLVEGRWLLAAAECD